MTKKWIIVLIVAVLLAGGVWGFLKTRGPKLISVKTADVVRKDLKETVSGSGVVQPDREVEVFAPVNDEIENIYAKEGETVGEDDHIVKLKNYGKLKSPLDGTVIQMNAAIGQTASMTKPLMVIADFDPTYFVANIDEGDISKVKPGQTAEIALDAYPETTLLGEVSEIGLVSVATTGGGTAFPVKIKLTDAKGVTLRVGMNGDATLTINVKQAVVAVPVEAVTERDGREVVFVAEKGMAKKRPVTLGLASDTDYEVVSGLSEGEKVVINNLSRLKGNEMITTKKLPEPPTQSGSRIF
jgi:multidrug efflux pump subunit AcrA (membrane-fusion protein)